jgi:hypothetical protein
MQDIWEQRLAEWNLVGCPVVAGIKWSGPSLTRIAVTA